MKRLLLFMILGEPRAKKVKLEQRKFQSCDIYKKAAIKIFTTLLELHKYDVLLSTLRSLFGDSWVESDSYTVLHVFLLSFETCSFFSYKTKQKLKKNAVRAPESTWFGISQWYLTIYIFFTAGILQVIFFRQEMNNPDTADSHIPNK